MSSDKLTRCPHCKAAFKVSEEQLEIANGRVRCGACMNVFDALAYSISESSQGQAAHPPEIDKSEDLQVDDLKTKTPEEELIQDDPEEDQEEQEAQSTALDDDLSDSFLELEKTGNQKSGAHFNEELEEDFHNAPDDESWATSMLEEEAREDHKRVPQAETEAQPATEPPKAASKAEHLSATPDDRIDTEENPYDTYDFGLPDETPDRSEHISFYYDPDETSTKKRHWAVSTLLVSANVILVVVLIGLASWFHYEKLAKYPQVASVYESACELLGCKLPELSDITKIRSRNLIVRSHPSTRNALIIDTIITNEADYAQDFPNLAIYFSDINNQTIAQRLIEPSQYLSAEILEWGKMPSNEPIHISLEIVDPGKQAVNYTLKFFPNKVVDESA